MPSAFYLLIVIIAVVVFFYWRALPTIKATARINNNLNKLTDPQRKLFLDTLTIAPTGSIDISAILDDFESLNFANELNRLFQKAGWQTNEVRSVNFVIKPKGLIITVHSSAETPVYARVLQQSFSSIGLRSQPGVNSQIAANTLNLIVGFEASKIK
jgi:hypothetical protein